MKAGNVEVKIYADTNRGKSRFTISYYTTAGVRQREFFSDLRTAKLAAQRVAATMQSGEADVLKLTNQDRSTYLHALRLIRPFQCSIDIAASEFAQARKILAGGATLVEAARFYAKHHPAQMPRKSVREVLDELLAAKRSDKKSDRYLSDLESRLGKFAAAFPKLISEITGPEMQDWLVSLNFAPRGRNNFRGVLSLFFNFARQRGYLPKQQPTEANDLTKAKAEETEIGIFSPKEMAKLLEHADESLVIYFAIGGFAGLRTAELQRLDWREVKLDQDVIEVTANKAKTARRRLVPIQPNLREWLRPFLQSSGPVCWLSTINQKASDFARKLGIAWPNNGLRHSYASYRLARCKSAPEVALEMGNSPQVVFQHYRELVTPRDAEKWWSIAPAEESKVVTMAS